MSDKYILVFDVDGTLATFRHAMDRRVADGLYHLEQAGHTIVFASGQPALSLEGMIRGLGLGRAIGVGENGAHMCRGFSNPPLFILPPLPFLDAVKKSIRERYPDVHFQSNIVTLAALTDSEQTLAGVAKILTREGYMDRDDVTVYLHNNTAEIVPRNVSKGGGIAYLKEMFGWETQRMIAVGDGVNDESMKPQVSEFFAVGDGIEALRNFENSVDMMTYMLGRFTPAR